MKLMTLLAVLSFPALFGMRSDAWAQANFTVAPARVQDMKAPPALLAKVQQRLAKQSRLDDAAASDLDSGNYALAERNARSSLALGQGSGVAQELLAAALNAQNKDQAALDAYKTLAVSGSDQPRNLLPYALLLLKNGRYPQAAAAYNKALPFLAFGDLMRTNGEFPPETQQFVELETACHVGLGLTWMGSGVWGGNPNYSRALDEYQKALQLSPDNALANLYKGDTLKRLGFKAQAQASYAKAAQDGEGDVKKAAQDALNGR